MYVRIANPLWRGKRSWHSRRMRNPQFCVSGKRPMQQQVVLDSTLGFGYTRDLNLVITVPSYVPAYIIRRSYDQDVTKVHSKFLGISVNSQELLLIKWLQPKMAPGILQNFHSIFIVKQSITDWYLIYILYWCNWTYSVTNLEFIHMGMVKVSTHHE